MTTKSLLTFALSTVAGTSISLGGLMSFSEDFESLDQSSPTALGDAGWLGFANVFDTGGNFLYDYGPFPAPNMTPGFSNITSGEGGPPQGAQGLVTFSDYNNGDHGNGLLIETNVFQEQTVNPGHMGLYRFQFDAKAGDLAGNSTALAFIKTLDPLAGFALTNFITIATDNLPVEWGTYNVDIHVDSSLDGQILQFGFLTTASNFEPSGVNYDNVHFRKVSVGGSTVLLLSCSLIGLAGLRRRFGSN